MGDIFKLIGIEEYDFTKESKTYRMAKLHFTCKKDKAQGECTYSCNLNRDKFDLQEVIIGFHYNIFYNQYGKPIHFAIVDEVE